MPNSPFGLLNLDKPAGITSRRVVDRVAAAVKPAKAGHAGTLDPLATGVLIVCVGRATRLIEYVQQLPKSYSARFLLGKSSDTDDVTGDLADVPVDVPPARDVVETALRSFVGRIDQVPPAFSAVHVEGKRAYKLARKGDQVELPPREVDVYRLQLLRYEYPDLDVEIDCGSGTYVRALGRDLGEVLGCGAVMSRLTRTAIGPFTLDAAVQLDDVSPASVAALLRPAADAVAHLRQHRCSEDDLQSLRHGRRIAAGRYFPRGEPVAILSPSGELAAIAEPADDGATLAPRQVFCA